MAISLSAAIIFVSTAFILAAMFWLERRIDALEEAVANLLRMPPDLLREVVDEIMRKQLKDAETRAKFDEESG